MISDFFDSLKGCESGSHPSHSIALSVTQIFLNYTTVRVSRRQAAASVVSPNAPDGAKGDCSQGR